MSASESWRCLNYCIRLTKTYENKDPKLTRVLNDIRDETLSHKTNNIIKNLQKTPKYPNDDIKVSELLSDSGKVNSINNKRLRMIQNKLYEYTAVDNVLGDDNDRHIKCFKWTIQDIQGNVLASRHQRQRLYSDEKLQKFHASLNILADS
nr:14362_t:CDS:2 [Entrophospora candida]